MESLVNFLKSAPERAKSLWKAILEFDRVFSGYVGWAGKLSMFLFFGSWMAEGMRLAGWRSLNYSGVPFGFREQLAVIEARDGMSLYVLSAWFALVIIEQIRLVRKLAKQDGDEPAVVHGPYWKPE